MGGICIVSTKWLIICTLVFVFTNDYCIIKAITAIALCGHINLQSCMYSCQLPKFPHCDVLFSVPSILDRDWCFIAAASAKLYYCCYLCSAPNCLVWLASTKRSLQQWHFPHYFHLRMSLSGCKKGLFQNSPLQKIS